MPFAFERLAIADVILVKPKRMGDARGWFTETYKRSDFAAHGIPDDFGQDNHAYSSQVGVLRGLHFQKDPQAQGKLVRCLRGSIFDVAVDLRKGSPTYAKWVGVQLTADDGHQLWVPPGFGHGYITQVPDCEVAYKTTAEYAPQLERTLRWDDPTVGVDWGNAAPVLAERDAKAPLLAALDHDFTYRGVL